MSKYQFNEHSVCINPEKEILIDQNGISVIIEWAQDQNNKYIFGCNISLGNSGFATPVSLKTSLKYESLLSGKQQSLDFICARYPDLSRSFQQLFSQPIQLKLF